MHSTESMPARSCSCQVNELVELSLAVIQMRPSMVEVRKELHERKVRCENWSLPWARRYRWALLSWLIRQLISKMAPCKHDAKDVTEGTCVCQVKLGCAPWCLGPGR